MQQFKGEHSRDTARVLAYVVLARPAELGFYTVAERQLAGGLTTGAIKG